MAKRISDLFLSNVEKFHSDNLYIPTRTIYFGGTNVLDDAPDEVNCKTIGQLIKNLHILESKEIAPISILMSTPGGSWEDGIAAYDLIKKLKSTITIIGLGKLYSMGSILFQSADKRVLTHNTTLMIHDGSDGFVGNAKDYENWAEFSKHIRKTMYKIYYDKMKKKKTKITLQDVENLCEHDTWYTSKEAIKIGLADKIM